MDVKPPAEQSNETMTLVMEVETKTEPSDYTLHEQRKTSMPGDVDIKPPAELSHEAQQSQTNTTGDMDIKPPLDSNVGFISMSPGVSHEAQQNETSATDIQDTKPPDEVINEPREDTMTLVMEVETKNEENSEEHYGQRTMANVMDVKIKTENEEQDVQKQLTTPDFMDIKIKTEPIYDQQDKMNDTLIEDNTATITTGLMGTGSQSDSGQSNKEIQKILLTKVLANNKRVESPSEPSNEELPPKKVLKLTNSTYILLNDEKTVTYQGNTNLPNTVLVRFPSEHNTGTLSLETMTTSEAQKETSNEQVEQRETRMTNIMYVEPAKNDKFLYCVSCQQEYEGDCPVHGPLIVVQNMKVEENDPDRALHSLPTNLLVKESDIDGAGLGVFTDTEIPPGTTYGPYEGMYITDPELAEASGYCWKVIINGVPSHFVDGKDTASSNWMRYVNCAQSESEQNLVAFQYKGEIFYRSCKPIIPKTELLVWYGNDCARKLGIIMDTNNEIVPTNPGMLSADPEVQISGQETPVVRVPHRELGYKCHICGQSFKDNTTMLSHLRSHYGGKAYKCQYCRKEFSTNSELNAHTRYHNIDQINQCQFCNKVFFKKSEFNKHMRIHIGDKPYACKYCDRTFGGDMANLIRHMRVHTGEKPFKCQYCDMAFRTISDITGHERIHTGNKPFKCDICDKAFTSKTSLDYHLRVHKGEKNYICEVCGKAFLTNKGLKEHMRIHNKDKSQKSTSVLDKAFTCTICDRVFCKQALLNRHIKKHTGEKSFKCTECDWAFFQKSDLNRHMRSHSGDKPFKCFYCDMTFKESYQRNCHMRRHTGDEPYMCEICGKSYIDNSTLKRHVRHHSKKRPFKCELCKKTFKEMCELNRHNKTKHSKDKAT